MPSLYTVNSEKWQSLASEDYFTQFVKAWIPSHNSQFLVGDAPNSVQQKIRSKVEASHQKREQSKQLLEIATTGVEHAIKTDEAAKAWFN